MYSQELADAEKEIESLQSRLASAETKLETFGILGNEFDRMHKMVHSRYVAERIFDYIYKESQDDD